MSVPKPFILAGVIALGFIVITVVIGGVGSAVIVSRALNSQTQELQRLIELQDARTAQMDSDPGEVIDKPESEDLSEEVIDRPEPELERATATVEVVSSIDFRDGDNEGRLMSGWYAREGGVTLRAFRWMSGKSEALLPPVSEAGDGWLRLVGAAKLDVHEPHQIKITVTLNGIWLGSTVVGEGGEFRISTKSHGNEKLCTPCCAYPLQRCLDGMQTTL